MKKNLLLLLLVLFNASASAFEGYAEIDGVRYYILTKGSFAEVTYKSDGYSGDVVIPSTITYEDVVCTVTAIQNSAMMLDTDLKSLSLPPTIKTIGEQAFWGCSGLKKINIPKSIVSIGTKAFYECTSLEEVWADDLESWCQIEIGQNANPLIYAQHLFFNGIEAKDLVIPNSITAIKDRTFSGYKGLTSLSFEGNVTSIGVSAFDSCSELLSVVMPNTITEIGAYAFYQCSKLSTLILSENLTAINQYCFYGCANLTSVTIPNSVTLVDYNAFRYCKSIKNIHIGSGLQKMGLVSFSGCPEITDVYCTAVVPPTMNTYYKDYMLPFYNSYPEYATLHVPLNSINDYKASPIWKNFGTFKPMEDTAVESFTMDITVKDVYNINGMCIDSQQKGLNIVRMSDGSIKKVCNK